MILHCILDNNHKVDIIKAFCENHGIPVTNVSGYFDKVYFEVFADRQQAEILESALGQL